MEYYLEYTPENYYHKDMIRRIFLAIAIVLDITAIVLIFSALVEPLIWIGIVCCIMISTISRILVNRYPTKYTYGVTCGKFCINSITPIASKELLNIDIQSIESINIANDTYKNAISEDKSILVLCDNSCQNDIYVLKLSDKSILIPLDEYLYTLIEHEIRG